MELPDIKNKIFTLLKAPQPSAEEWSDVGVYLEMLWAQAQRIMRAKELTAHQAFKTIRRSEGMKSRADAEIDWLASPEYKDFKDAEDNVEEIVRWTARATNESAARRKQ